MRFRKALSAPAATWRAGLRRCLTMAVAGMASYWSACAEQRRCLASP